MLKNTTIGIKTHFDAAHHLPFHEGKCKNVHGHTWDVEVEVGPVDYDPDRVWGMDLGILKKMVADIIEPFDHELVNEIIDVPTCEMLVKFLYVALTAKLAKLDRYDYLIEVTKVKVREGKGGWAEWRKHE